MKEFRFTFGQRYRREVHPCLAEAHPDGWMTVEAEDYDQAREIAVSELGADWAFQYEEPFDEQEWARLYPLGEIGWCQIAGKIGWGQNAVLTRNVEVPPAVPTPQQSP